MCPIHVAKYVLLMSCSPSIGMLVHCGLERLLGQRGVVFLDGQRVADRCNAFNYHSHDFHTFSIAWAMGLEYRMMNLEY
jgi:hypothetical protein